MEYFKTLPSCDGPTAHKTRPSRHTPHAELPQEIVEKRNLRERRRVTTVNDEFSRLQRLLPTIRHRARRVPKERILRLAATYIRNLSLLLNADRSAATTQRSPLAGANVDSDRVYKLNAQREDRPTGSGAWKTHEDTWYFGLAHEHYNDNPMDATAAPIGSSPHSLPGLHGGGSVRMPALEDAINGAAYGAGTRPHSNHAQVPVNGSWLQEQSGGCRVPVEDVDGGCGFYQQQFRFRPQSTPDGLAWDVSTVSPPGGLAVNVTYSNHYSDRCQYSVPSSPLWETLDTLM